MAINPRLLQLAQHTVWRNASREKQAIGAPGDPAAQGGAMGGGAPPGAGGQPMSPPPGMSPPPMPPGGGGMMPGMDPMGGMGGMGGGMPGQMPGQGQQKVKPEQWMQQLDYRLYNMQQLLTALANTMQVQIPPGALIMPPGTPMAPPMEAALPGGQADPTQQQQGGGGQSAIGTIDPIQGASPELAQAGGGGAGAGGGGAPAPAPGKQAAANPLALFAASLFDDPTAHVGSPYGEPAQDSDIQNSAATVAALLRSRTANTAA